MKMECDRAISSGRIVFEHPVLGQRTRRFFLKSSLHCVVNPTTMTTTRMPLLMLFSLFLLVSYSNALFVNADNNRPAIFQDVNNPPSPSHVSSCPATASSTVPAAAADSNAAFEENLRLDANRLRRTIDAGRVYRQRDFLSPSQVSYLLREVKDLEERGVFERSGLSNTAQKRQGFGRKDRQLCPVPWWADSLANGDESVQAQVLASNNNPVAAVLQQLRLSLAQVLNRPTMADPSLQHECYYSTASDGSFLPRHMDERHEETKGPKGWLLPSRRSLSWLVYLTDEGWTLDENGGALRYFPQQTLSPASSTGSQHEGNLQVGWLLDGMSGSRPVYLDSWYPVAQHLTCVLYKVFDGERVLLTKPWQTESLAGTPVVDFLKESAALQQQNAKGSGGSSGLFLEDARNFVLLEDRAEWDKGMIPAGSVPMDVNPERASLVVFDSVMVPHQVEEILKGRRIALAGWFHEGTTELKCCWISSCSVAEDSHSNKIRVVFLLSATQGFPSDLSIGEAS